MSNDTNQIDLERPSRLAVIFIFSALAVSIVLSCSKENNESLSSLYVETAVAPSDLTEYTNVVLKWKNAHENMAFEGSMRIRGGYSRRYPKKSFELDLPYPLAFDGLPADEDWILNSNYVDKTFSRHTVSYDLFTDMSRNNYSSYSTPIELYWNNEYQGLYLLMTKIDPSSLGIDKYDKDAFIFKDPPVFRKNLDNFGPQRKDNYYQQVYPALTERDMSPQLILIRQSLLEYSSLELQNFLHQNFDIQNLLDWHLYILISNGADNVVKNFYLYRMSDADVMRIALWDCDHSFGRDGDNEKNIGKSHVQFEKSILFGRLIQMEWYQDLLKQRWSFLIEEEILSKRAIYNRFRANMEALEVPAEKNFRKWPLDSEYYYDGNEYQQELQLIDSFLNYQFPRVNDYIKSL